MNGTPSGRMTGRSARAIGGVAALALLLSGTTPASAAGSDAVITDAGCTANTFARNDDGSIASPLGFDVNFFDVEFNSVFVNNNGNLTVGSPMSTFTPFDFTLGTRPIIAPFFADVDTRGTSNGSLPVQFGNITIDGHNVFCVNYVDVGYFSSQTDKLNSFQVLIVQRTDTGAGNFDLIFNYDRMLWETGGASGGTGGFGGTPARAGFTNGDGDPLHSATLSGSGISLGLLDNNLSTGLVNNRIGPSTLPSLPEQDGRYVFPVRNLPPTGSTLIGSVLAPNDAPLSGAPVNLCFGPQDCPHTRFTGSDGMFRFNNIPGGDWFLLGFPPSSGPNFAPGNSDPFPVSGVPGEIFEQNVQLGPAPGAPPAGTSITNIGFTSDGTPIVYWNQPLVLEAEGCVGGAASFEILFDGSVIRSGSMTETPSDSGIFISSAIQPLMPNSGLAIVNITIFCPDPADDEDFDFEIYIDPSGHVIDADTGEAIPGAIVTLLRSATPDGTQVPVPDGSAIMSPSNRTNPDTTDADGFFAWDVIPGFYVVVAESPGCEPNQTEVLPVPPPQLDLIIELECGNEAVPRTLTIHKIGTGSGTVTSDPAGIDCGADCDGVFPRRTMVTLTAVPDGGSIFAGWDGGGCAGELGACITRMGNDKAVTALFTLTGAGRRTLKVIKVGRGRGVVTSQPGSIDCGAVCAHAFVLGKRVILTAEAGPNSTFLGWRWPPRCGQSARCALRVNKPARAIAWFAPNSCVAPRVRDLTLRQAKVAIWKTECKVGAISHSFSADVPRNVVISQSPSAGTRMVKGSPVRMRVSLGRRPRR